MWYKINDRELTIDKVLFETSYPIIFTCQDQNGKIYFCVCCQNNETGRRWLIAEVLADFIIEFLENKVSARKIFLQHRHWCVFDNGCGMRMVSDESVWDNDSDYLPKTDSFLEPDEGEYDEEIEYYKSLLDQRLSAKWTIRRVNEAYRVLTMVEYGNDILVELGTPMSVCEYSFNQEGTSVSLKNSIIAA